MNFLGFDVLNDIEGPSIRLLLVMFIGSANITYASCWPLSMRVHYFYRKVWNSFHHSDNENHPYVLFPFLVIEACDILKSSPWPDFGININRKDLWILADKLVSFIYNLCNVCLQIMFPCLLHSSPLHFCNS